MGIFLSLEMTLRYYCWRQNSSPRVSKLKGSVKGQRAATLGFVGHVASVATTHCSHLRAEAPMDHRETKGRAVSQ